MPTPPDPSNPLRNPNLWNTARLGGVITPGQVRITGGVSARKWTVWGGFGLSYGTSIFTGIDIKNFGMRLEFWEPEQIDEYTSKIVPLLEVPRNNNGTIIRPNALSFFHPAVSLPPLKIRGVGVEEVTQLQQDDLGLWWVDIKLIPYFTPVPGLAKPIAADDNKPTPQNENQRVILQLVEEIQKYAKP